MSEKNLLERKIAEQEQKSRDFGELLSTITSLEDKKKTLWIQIYENAVEDRTNAYILFTDLYLACQGKSAEYQLNGATIAKFIERMSRSNDQILKLAELIQNSVQAEEVISENDIYETIQGKR